MSYVVGPANLAWTAGFIAGTNAPPRPGIPPGDHLQTAYNLWLWKDSITTLTHWPWWDPYLYGAISRGLPQPFGWPIVLYTVPVTLAWGPVAGYNAAVVAGFLLAAVMMFALCRTLGCGPAAAAVGGFAYAFAPFRILQGAVHANAMLAWMLPLLLVCYENALTRRGKRATVAAWMAVAVQVSIIFSGEFHLANYSVLLSAAWLLARAPRIPREHLRTLLAPAAVGVVAMSAAVAVEFVLVIGPAVAEGRSSAEAFAYAPRLVDFLRPDPVGIGNERYVYLGVVIALLALRGFRVMVADAGNRRVLAWLLAAGVLAACFLAVSPGAPVEAIREVYRYVPVLSFSRTPGRIAFLTAMFLAVLAAFAVEDLPSKRARRLVAVLASTLIALDAPRGLYTLLPGPVRPIPGIARGATVLDLPAFDAVDVHASVYSFYLMSRPGPRVGGYSMLATPAARERQLASSVLQETPIDRRVWHDQAAELGFQYVAVHKRLFALAGRTGHGVQLVDTLTATPGFRLVSARDEIVVFEVSSAQIPREPSQ